MTITIYVYLFISLKIYLLLYIYIYLFIYLLLRGPIRPKRSPFGKLFYPWILRVEEVT